MLVQQYYLKTLTTILVFSFLFCYFLYVSTTYLLENVDIFSSIGSYQNQLRRNAAVTASNVVSIHESLSYEQATHESPRKYNEKYQKTIGVHKIRRKRFSTYRTRKSITMHEESEESDKNYWHELKSNVSNLTGKDVLKNFFLRSLKLNKTELIALEKRTKNQYKCKEWLVERKKRLTASTFGKICKMRINTSRQKYVEELLYGTFEGNDATAHGLKFENTAKKALENVLGKKIRSAGLMVDYDLPFLAASPDGLVARNALVEIKCPHAAKNMTPIDGIISNKIKYCRIKDGQMHLKKTSHYYFQIQGQLHISCKLFCYFCVWTPKGMVFEMIQRNDTFWKINMENKLKTFYFDNMLPEIILNKKTKKEFIKVLKY